MSQDVQDGHPRWLNIAAAAQYLCLSIDSFRRKVKAGVLPAPSRALGPKSPRWDRLTLDAVMEGKTATPGRPTSIDRLIENILAGKTGRGRRRRSGST